MAKRRVRGIRGRGGLRGGRRRRRGKYNIYVDAARQSGSVFKLRKSNINAKPVINNLSASSGRATGEGGHRRKRSRGALRGRGRRAETREGTSREGGGGRRREGEGGGYIIPAPWGLRASPSRTRRESIGCSLPRSRGEREATIQVGGTKGILEKEGGGVLTLR